jgi:hypothetical protein
LPLETGVAPGVHAFGHACTVEVHVQQN